MAWADLWGMCGILLRLIRSDRECDFDLHLAAVAQSLPYFFAFNKPNYARWVSVYLADMHTLPVTAPLVYKELKFGDALAVRSTKQAFNGVPLDMRLEQSLNRFAKETIKRVSSNKPARDRVILTAHHAASLEMALEDMCGLIHEIPVVNKEVGKQRMLKDECDVARLVVTLSGKMLNPFNTDGLPLIQFATRHIATEQIQKTFTDAVKIGKEQMEVFVQNRLQTNTTNLSIKISRNKIPMFGKSKASTSSHKYASTSCGVFSTLLLQNKPLNEALMEELNVDNPSSLFREDGSFIKKDKSILLHALEKDITEVSRMFPLNAEAHEICVIFDVMALLHNQLRYLKTAATFGDVAKILLDKILHQPHQLRHLPNLNHLRWDAVMDIYSECSTKGLEHENRVRKGAAGMSALPTMISGCDQECPTNLDAFLDANSNKVELLKFLTERWCIEAPKILQSQQTLYIGGGKQSKSWKVTETDVMIVPALAADVEEADARLLLHMMHAVNVDKRKYGLLVASDTDIAVIGIGALNDLKHCEIYQSVSQRLIPLHIINAKLGNRKASALVAFHALTGCDTNSYFSCRKSKKSLWEQACNDVGVLEGMSTFGTDIQPPTSVPKWLVSFVIKAYACKETKDMDIIGARIKRLKVLSSMKNDSDIDKFLPPTLNALLPHVQRAALQTYYWRKGCTTPPLQLPTPELFGWKKEGTKMVPVKTCKVDTEPEVNKMDKNDMDVTANSEDNEESTDSDEYEETMDSEEYEETMDREEYDVSTDSDSEY